MALPAVPRIAMQEHLPNLSAPTDVTFILHSFQDEGTEQRTHTHDVVFPAHRDRLLAAAPFFECLLAGSRSADGTVLPWKHEDEVTIEDCPPDAFSILLRWIYGDEEVLDINGSSTFVAVLLGADRFGIEDLVSRLLDWAEYPPTEDFFYDVFSMLNHRQIGCANELTKRCLRYFDANATALTKHASFLSISHEHLRKILTRNSLVLREIDVYGATTKLARAQLERTNKRRTDEAMREVLGEALFLIRFPTMHPQDFTDGAANDNILLAEASSKLSLEKVAIYRSFHSADPTLCAFSAEPRTGASKLPLRCFDPTYCQTCGARMNDDICLVCGCVYRLTVECPGCNERVEVDYTDEFDWDYSHEEARRPNDEEACRAVAYRCSCGLPNMTNGKGPSWCKRCPVRVWRCCGDGSMSLDACKCEDCEKEWGEYYSDEEDDSDVGDNNGA